MASVASVADGLAFDEASRRWTSFKANLLAEDLALPATCFLFLPSMDWYKECHDSTRRMILSPFNPPNFLCNKTCTDLNGYFGSRSSFAEDATANGELTGCSTWLRVLTLHVNPQYKTTREQSQSVESGDKTPTCQQKNYAWYEMGIFTDWTASGTRRLLCIGAPDDVHEHVQNILTAQNAPSVEFGDPTAMFRPFLEYLITLCDQHTWQLTKIVRSVEQSREARPDFQVLRNLARHTGHLVEVQQVTIESLEQLVQLQQQCFQNRTGLTESYKVQATEYLAFQLQAFKSLRWRAQSTHERLGEEINLCYNMLANSDNAIMKSITLLTMFFLPGTFIAALFSSSFFSFQEDGWKFSNKFWIYWAVTIPVTLTLVFAWWRWLGGSYAQIRSNWLSEKEGRRSISMR